MRRIAFFILLFSFYACNNNHDPVSNISLNEEYSLDGTACQMDYSREIKSDTSFNHIPPSLRRIKMFTKNRWAFLGSDFAKKEIAGMGSGTYTLSGGVTYFIAFLSL